uniref:ADP-dependent glucokinase n=1 Tax=Acrobeloides nanus TaxID=290746 RepID=A0A914DQ06_9BILA
MFKLPFPFNSPYNYLLYWSIVFAAVPWLYSYFNDHHRLATMTIEKAITKSWDRVMTQPSIKFRRLMIGINCNVDVVVSGVSLMNKLNASGVDAGDKSQLNSVNDLYGTFIHFFSKGAPAERYMADEDTFQLLVKIATEHREIKPMYHIGGNAALFAQKIASSFPLTIAFLVGPIGPRANALLHPSIVRNNSTRIAEDELHIILEYKQGEILGEYVSPASSRFITSHDQFSSSSIVIEMFFKAIAQFRPDVIVLTGVHLMESQPNSVRQEKLRLIKRNLLQVDPIIPIHLHIGSMGDPSFASEVLQRVIPFVDSLGLNEQELSFFTKVGNGPFGNQYPISAGTIHVHKVVEMLYWLLTNFGNDKDPDSKNYNYRLERIHFHCLTYHIMVSRGSDWSNLAASLAAGARVAGRQACNRDAEKTDYEMLEVRTGTSGKILLDKSIDKIYEFDPHNPIVSWMRNDIIFMFTPVLVCKFPIRTVGIDDAISASSLMYAQYYKMEKTR